MARKTAQFQWTGEGNEPWDLAERPDRKEARLEKRSLDSLARRLAALSPGERKNLPLDELLQAEITTLANLGRTPAHKRQLLRVQGLLRQADLVEVEGRLAGAVPDAARLRDLERWRTALIEGGDAELATFMTAYPTANRRQLRGLIRQARGEGPAAQKAARRMFQVMKAVGPVGEE